MKNRFYSLFAFLIFSISSIASEVPAPQNIFAREIRTLNGTWNYFVDMQEQGYYDYRMQPIQWGYFLNAKPQKPSDLIEYDFDKSPTMQIPCDWNTADERLFFYEGTVWFRRLFNYTPQAGKRALLYFGAVNYESIVFVNGQKMGQHIGGFTPFCYDVTDVLREGENFIVVKVDNKRHTDNVPTRNFDWWNYGGITRDVLLAYVDETYIEDYTIQLTGKQHNSIDFSVKLNKKEAGKEISLSIPELKIKKTVITDAEGKASLTIPKTKPQLWEPENPKLYTVQLQHGNEKINDQIGFRTIEAQGKQILLNGKPIFLCGVCVHEETAYTNRRITSATDADTLISWAKSMNCNFLRLAHYPHNEHTIREAEKQGILLWAEIPVYWTISWHNPATYDNAHRQLSDLISRDKNRAAVIIWSIANETPHGKERDSFLSKLATSARNQDSTRLISMAMEVLSASNYVNRLQDNMHPYVDVISFNQYVGWYRDVNDAKKMKWEIPYNKPVIVSEFGGGAKAGKHGSADERWTEEFQERLYEENLDMIDRIEGLAGICPWVLKDFRSPRRPLPEIQDLFNRKGLISDQGERKKAFYVLREWYEKKSKDF